MNPKVVSPREPCFPQVLRITVSMLRMPPNDQRTYPKNRREIGRTRGLTMLIPFLLLAVATLPSCTKVLVYGKDRPMEPLEKRFSAPPPETFQSARKALEILGYKIDEVDSVNRTVKSGWIATKPNSHYLDLFDRKDYGTTGTYYQVVIHVEEEAAESLVSVSTPVRSLIPHITTSYREERKILKKMADLVRRNDFEMTNVGVKD